MQFYANWSFWLYFAAWLPYTLLIITYGSGSPWYRSAIGRSLMFTKVAIVLVLTNVLVTYIWGDYGWRDVTRALLLGVVIAAGWYQFATILREQRQDRYDHPAC